MIDIVCFSKMEKLHMISVSRIPMFLRTGRLRPIRAYGTGDRSPLAGHHFKEEQQMQNRNADMAFCE